MNIFLKLLGIVFASLLLSGCAVFEAINAENPLPGPDEYGKDARAIGSPFPGGGYSRERSNRDLNTGSTFADWHNDQYR